jgi:hypothetical protein
VWPAPKATGAVPAEKREAAVRLAPVPGGVLLQGAF